MEVSVQAKFDSYPDAARKQLLRIREAIFEVAKEEALGTVTETLKWNEPSYSTTKGSTVRIDWKAKHPEQVSIFFHCQTSLVETFKELYGGVFRYVGNREITLELAKQIPMAELKACISMALRYHSIKHLHLLGA